MTEQELNDRFIGIHAEYKDINTTLQLLTQEQVRNNTESKAAFRSINRHLERLNSSVARHEMCINKLSNFKLETETAKEVNDYYRKEAKTNRRLLYAAVLGLLASLIMSIWDKFIV